MGTQLSPFYLIHFLSIIVHFKIFNYLLLPHFPLFLSLFTSLPSPLLLLLPSLLQERDNRVYIAMIHRVLDTAGFYYSYSYDLTHTKQRLNQLSRDNPSFHQLPIFNRVSNYNILLHVHVHLLLVSPHLCVGESKALWLSFCLSVILPSREVTFRSSNVSIAFSTATSLFPLIGKVTFYCTFVSREPRKV